VLAGWQCHPFFVALVAAADIGDQGRISSGEWHYFVDAKLVFNKKCSILPTV
jgi:hypothetical protein